MADVVNLRTARKQRARAEARRRVAVKAGDEAERAKAATALERRRLEGHRLDGPPGGATGREDGGPAGD